VVKNIGGVDLMEVLIGVTITDETFAWFKNWTIRNYNGWEMDWSNKNQRKYYVFCDYSYQKWSLDWRYSYRNDATYMSEENAKKLIDILNK